jgi:hypothetical protein
MGCDAVKSGNSGTYQRLRETSYLHFLCQCDRLKIDMSDFSRALICTNIYLVTLCHTTEDRKLSQNYWVFVLSPSSGVL